MSTEEMFTSLPTVSSAQMTDIICAVQGYSNPSSLGVSVQETLSQVYSLFQSNVILYNAGNPNSTVAGTTYQLLWDTTDSILYVCTTTGNASTAVWTPCIGQLTNGQLRIGSTGAAPVAATLTAGPGVSIVNGAGSITISSTGASVGWNVVTSGSASMTAEGGYITNFGTLVTLTLPTVAAVGTGLSVIGKGAGGWSIVFNSGQTIQVGSATATTTSGSVSSTNQYDSINLICTTANVEWTVLGGPQSSGLTIV